MNRKFEKIVVATVVLISATAIVAIPVQCDLRIFSDPIQTMQTSEPQVFRLLAVEGTASNDRMRDAQFLIQALIKFANWKNSSKYTSYIELLSLFNQSELFDDVKKFYAGQANKSRVRERIINFLGAAQPGEITIFYVAVDGGGDATLVFDEIITAAELTSWLTSGGLPQAYLGVILESCFSGSWINDGIPPGGPLGPGRVVLCSSRSNQLSWGFAENWAWFTGQEKAIGWSIDGHKEPLGVIGGLFAANDLDGDGWISALEDFEFARNSTERYASIRNITQTPVAFNDLEDLPLVLIPQLLIANFSFSPQIPWINESVTFNGSASRAQNGDITRYEWNFGDGNITEITEPTINHTYTKEGNYTVILQVTNDLGTSNTTALNMAVTFNTDLNRDKTVNIVDISIVARAFGSRAGDPKWNATADLDKNEWVNIIDITMVARDYGKTT